MTVSDKKIAAECLGNVFGCALRPTPALGDKILQGSKTLGRKGNQVIEKMDEMVWKCPGGAFAISANALEKT